MSETPAKILIADDDPRIQNLLECILSKAGFEVLQAVNGPGVFEVVKKQLPDLFLLDVTMPNMDGLEVCRRLKEDERTRRIPVIFITARDKTDDIIKGFEAGAADYITKPINKATMLVRARTHLKLYSSILELERLNHLALEANPLTGLPGNNSLSEAIRNAVEENSSLTVLYCDLDNFKAFNDKYGFARGDAAILFTADTLRKSAEDLCGSGCFVGHIGGDDFSLLVPSDKGPTVAGEIVRRFDGGVGELYAAEDRQAGGIESVNRKGEKQFFPVMSITIAGVDLSQRRYGHYLEVVNACAELKKFAKETPGSGVWFDRRAPESL